MLEATLATIKRSRRGATPFFPLEPGVDGDAYQDGGGTVERVSGFGFEREEYDTERGQDEDGGQDGVAGDAVLPWLRVALAEDEDGAGGESVEDPFGEDGEGEECTEECD